MNKSSVTDSQASSDRSEGLPVTEEAKRQLVERIIASRHLRRSTRLTELLKYLTEKSIRGESDGLREQEIGGRIFGRGDDYDTSQDNIVRVQVSQLRRKLEAYFEQSRAEGQEEPVILEIPRGGYLPVFIMRGRPEDASMPEPLVPTTPVSVAYRRGSRLVISLLTVSTIFFALLAGWLWRTRTPSPTVPDRIPGWTNAINGQSVAALWGTLLKKDQPTDVILADSTLTILQDLGGRQLELEEVLQRRFSETLPAALPAREREQLISIVARRYTSLTDVKLGRKILRLGLENQNIPEFHIAREYQMRSFKSNNVIILGSRRSNPWVELIEPGMNFHFEYRPGEKNPVVINRAPHHGEPATLTTDTQGVGYAIIGFLPNFDRTGSVLILSGNNSVSTEAAGDFVTSEEQLAEFFKLIGYATTGSPDSRPPWFEVLLRTEKLQGVPLSFKTIGYRVVGQTPDSLP